MASAQKTPGGSIVLKVLIVFLIAVLGYAIWFPKQQWEEQGRDVLVARQRMENLYNAGNLFYFFNKRFPQSIEEIVQALDTTFVDAEPVHFQAETKQNMDLWAEREDLQRVEFRSPEDDQRLAQLQELIRDSLLITAEDTMRIREFKVIDLGKNKVTGADGLARELYQVRVIADMKPLYAGISSDTLCLDSIEPITVIERKAGDLSRDLWASTGGTFLTRGPLGFFAAGPMTRQPVKSYSLSLPLDEIGTCPASGKAFHMKHVGKYTYKGTYRFVLDGAAGDALTTLSQKQAFLGALKNQASGAMGVIFTAMADSALKAGNAQFRIPEDVQVAVTVKETLALLPKLKPKTELTATADHSLIAGLDSLDLYTPESKRTELLFPEFKGDVAKPFTLLLENAGIQALVERVRMLPNLEPVKIDTVGMAVYSPIDGTERYQSGWKRIFEVHAPENHGHIYNGTKSWE